MGNPLGRKGLKNNRNKASIKCSLCSAQSRRLRTEINPNYPGYKFFHGCYVEKQCMALSLSCPTSTFVDFTLSNARQFYSSTRNPLGRKGLKPWNLLDCLAFFCYIRTFIFSRMYSCCKKSPSRKKADQYGNHYFSSLHQYKPLPLVLTNTTGIRTQTVILPI